MNSVTEFCNLSLSHIGVRPLTSFDEDDTKEARQCRLMYPITRDSVLRAHDWNFAAKIVTLAEVAGETVAGWDYVYGRPASSLHIRKVYSESNVNAGVPPNFRAILAPSSNTKIIVSNEQLAICEFTLAVTDVSLFDTAYIEAGALKLASVLAKPLTGNIDLGVKLGSFYVQSIGEARRANIAEGNPPRNQTSSYISARS